jgi:hypothetical protein
MHGPSTELLASHAALNIVIIFIYLVFAKGHKANNSYEGFVERNTYYEMEFTNPFQISLEVL